MPSDNPHSSMPLTRVRIASWPESSTEFPDQRTAPFDDRARAAREQVERRPIAASDHSRPPAPFARAGRAAEPFDRAAICAVSSNRGHWNAGPRVAAVLDCGVFVRWVVMVGDPSHLPVRRALVDRAAAPLGRAAICAVSSNRVRWNVRVGGPAASVRGADRGE